MAIPSDNQSKPVDTSSVHHETAVPDAKKSEGDQKMKQIAEIAIGDTIVDRGSDHAKVEDDRVKVVGRSKDSYEISTMKRIFNREVFSKGKEGEDARNIAKQALVEGGKKMLKAALQIDEKATEKFYDEILDAFDGLKQEGAVWRVLDEISQSDVKSMTPEQRDRFKEIIEKRTGEAGTIALKQGQLKHRNDLLQACGGNFKPGVMEKTGEALKKGKTALESKLYKKERDNFDATMDRLENAHFHAGKPGSFYEIFPRKQDVNLSHLTSEQKARFKKNLENALTDENVMAANAPGVGGGAMVNAAQAMLDELKK